MSTLQTNLKKIYKSHIFIWLVSCILLTYLVEKISIGFSNKIYFDQTSPLSCFIYNLLFIMISTSIIFLFKRRLFLFTILSSIWLGLAFGNMMLLSFRSSPLTMSDIQMVKMGASLINQYFTKAQICLAIILLIALVASFVFIFIKGPKKEKVNYLLVIPSLIVFTIFFKGYSNIIIDKGIVSNNFWDINWSYQNYGFPYCFSNTVFNYGIEKPSSYNELSMTSLAADLNSDSLATTDTNSIDFVSVTSDDYAIKPNIIMVQLESFFDPTLINDLTFSSDPIPNFRQLSEQFSSGYLTVPTIGGGTCNTEFEAITGLSSKLFGPGQFPYNSILQSSTCESISYYLKEQGYYTTAMHNHFGTFYGRNIAYSNLGFDRFISRETMNTWDRTPLTYAKDTIFIKDIPDLMKFTDETDFIYAVSMQGHGSYPDYKILEDVSISVDGENLSDGDKNKWEYYTHQINEMDTVVAELINSVNELNEPTVIAFYGDHLPGLNITNDRLTKSDIYMTPLLIWDNLGLEKDDLSLTSYQLSAYLLDKLNLEGGAVSSLHQLKSANEDYLEELHALEYDILYGKKYTYGGESPYNKTNMVFGLKEPAVGAIEFEDDLIILQGGNFTESSVVCVNGENVETLFFGDTMLALSNKSLHQGDIYTIRQVSNDGTVLMETFEYEF